MGDITNKTRKSCPRMIVHGVGGCGKSSFASFFPRPIFLQSPGETGVETLRQAGQVPPVDVAQFRRYQTDENGQYVQNENGYVQESVSQAQTWEDILDFIDMLTFEQHNYKTLVIDVLNGVEKLCHDFTCREDYNGDWSDKQGGFMNYQKGYDVAASRHWKDLLAKIDRLRERREMYFIGLCHSKVKNFKNPAGPDYDQWRPALQNPTWEMTFGWADICFFFNYEVFADKIKGQSKAKATGGTTRVCYTENHAAYDAKHRHGLPSSFLLGNSGQEAFNSFIHELQQAKKPFAENAQPVDQPTKKEGE